MFSFLVLVTIVVGVVAAVQLSKVSQLAAKLRNKREEEISDADNKMNAWLMMIFMIGFFISTIYLYAVYGNHYGDNGDFLPTAASKHGVDYDWLLLLNFLIITIVFFIVQFALFFCAWKYYYRKDRKALFFVIAGIEEKLAAQGSYLPPAEVEELEDKIYRLGRHKLRLRDLGVSNKVASNEVAKGMDDLIVKGELHLPVDREVEFVFNSRDVIHSAYFPHFRAQMNTVPGQPTRFKMTPTITTAKMRKDLEDDKFDYILLCNKVCGASHNNMAVKVIIESQEEYDKWLNEQKTFASIVNG